MIPKVHTFHQRKSIKKNVQHYYRCNSFGLRVGKKVTVIQTLNAFKNIIESIFSNLLITTRTPLFHFRIYSVELLVDFIKMFIGKIIIHSYSKKYIIFLNLF